MKTAYEILMEAPDSQATRCRIMMRAVLAGDWGEAAFTLRHAADEETGAWADDARALVENFEALESGTLAGEIKAFGEVREGGCILRVEGGMYVMEMSRNVFNRHTLSVGSTDEARLGAHWRQFVAANR